MTEIPLGRRRPPRCPICGATPEPRFHPFCSARCADVDLNRWLTGVYAIPASESEDDDQENEGRE
ncbi:MAG: DNA gyrase inhibitor YacG [Alphaproteobacteria bacterium]|nr:DNA gyrase inhibitor YacG [Alphaproteobacteria bacterium]